MMLGSNISSQLLFYSFVSSKVDGMGRTCNAFNIQTTIPVRKLVGDIPAPTATLAIPLHKERTPSVEDI